MVKIANQDKNIVQSFQYLTNYRHDIPKAKTIEKVKSDHLDSNDIILFRINEITFEEDAPRQEALENVFAAFRHITGVNFIYLIIGNKEGVKFYFGLSKDVESESDENIQTLGKSILISSLEGNFRGSKIDIVPEVEKRIIMNNLVPPSDNMFYATLDGVPGINKDDEKRIFRVLTGLLM
uniref:Uncharacterized protein n=1 Tax=uncultured bacterium contig00062 TaxID=1181545 RepID=A0A806KG08_9BACT|nr:hypothetical protein [uncultured bacterium contig00062]